MSLICPATGSSASAQPVSITFCSGRSATASASGSAMASHSTRTVLARTRSHGRCEPAVTWWFARSGMGAGAWGCGEGPGPPAGPVGAAGPAGAAGAAGHAVPAAEVAFLSYVLYFGRRAVAAGLTADIEAPPDTLPVAA